MVYLVLWFSFIALSTQLDQEPDSMLKIDDLENYNPQNEYYPPPVFNSYLLCDMNGYCETCNTIMECASLGKYGFIYPLFDFNSMVQVSENASPNKKENSFLEIQNN